MKKELNALAPQGSKLTGTYRGAAQIRTELAGAAGGNNIQ